MGYAVVSLHDYVLKRWIISSFLIALCFSGINATEESSVFQTIIDRIQANHKNIDISSVEKDIDSFFSLLKNDGSFFDIDYSSRAQTNWLPVLHLDRIKKMVLGYTTSGNRYGDERLYTSIVSGLNYWYDTHPTSTNWFMQQIACPQRMGVILILMRSGKKQLPPELERKLIDRMETEGGRPDQKGSQGTAANKLAIATHWIYRGCLTKDEEVLAFGIEQAYQPVQFTTGQGIQYDYSYQQHGKQLHIGGYGTGIADEISQLALYTKDTPYMLPKEKLDIFCGFIREAYVPVIRGKHFLFNVLGRGLSRPDALSQSSFIPVLQRMIILDPAYASIYKNSIDRIRQEINSSFGVEANHTHFWCSDYTLHQRLTYAFDVRMGSVFTTRSENGNGENLKGFFLTEGATAIVKEGNEYENIFPVWDWTKIPGTTVPAVSEIPLPGQWEKPGTSIFAGGVSDGKYGVSAYSMDEKLYEVNTAANKSWFFFDNEIVCLGAGIHSTNPHEVCTTIDQCLLQDKVKVISGNSTKELPPGTHHYPNVPGILHNEVAYVFPDGGNIHIENQKQQGTWKSINNSQSDEVISKEVLKIWLDHGSKPENAKYSYIVIPAFTHSSGDLSCMKGDITILTNTPSVQAVQHNKLQVMGIAFHEAGIFSCDLFRISVDKGCILLITDMDREEIKFYISDPSRSESVINLKTDIYGVGKKEVTFPFPVHPDPYAGKTFGYAFNIHTLSYRNL